MSSRSRRSRSIPTSTATRDEYVTRLQTLGLGGDLEHIITSAYATAHYLERLMPKPKDVLVVGADGLRSEIRAVGIGVRDADSLPGIDPPPDAAVSPVTLASGVAAPLRLLSTRCRAPHFTSHSASTLPKPPNAPVMR